MTTFTLFRYSGFQKAWAFSQMAFAPPLLKKTQELDFFKMLGTGRGTGFSIRPDFSRYGLLGVWESETAADEFFKSSPLFKKFLQHSDEYWTVKLQPYQAHGKWDGVAPFKTDKNILLKTPVAVLTRATIRPQRLQRFWQFVPDTSAELDAARGRIASIGIGEAPFFRQATLSFWHDEESVKDFAYRSPKHREVVRLTREEAWYSEELFARFEVVGSEGTWGGVNPLEDFKKF
jgi:heme-degrading monooxygenase HmoA